MRFFLLLLSLPLGGLFLGCSYHFMVPAQMPGGYDRVVVPLFMNRSHETGAEVYFTNALITEIERAHMVTLSSSSEAQVSVEGSLREIIYDAPSGDVSSPSNVALSSKQTITVRVDILVRRNSDRQVLWERAFERSKTYSSPSVGIATINSANALYNHSARHENLRLLAQEMMSEAYDRMTENF